MQCTIIERAIAGPARGVQGSRSAHPLSRCYLSRAVPTCTALIVAGRPRSRFGGPLPKQYAAFGGQPVLRRTLAVFQAAPRDRPDPGRDRPRATKRTTGQPAEASSLPPPVDGGASRQHSVLNGLEALAAQPPDLVAIHDAARPFVRPADIDRLPGSPAAPAVDGAVLGVPVADTLKRVDDAGVVVRDGAARRPVAGADAAGLPLRSRCSTRIAPPRRSARRSDGAHRRCRGRRARRSQASSWSTGNED